ncbi:LPS export ABC transporter ATP-binding protein [Treponema sp. OMZ 857]|nr:LPS export ABC transporter ATP-binding protein [Treponema sp. OMZ 857]
MSDGLNYLSEEDTMHHNIEHSEQNTEIALLNTEPFRDAESNDEPVQSDFLYASRYFTDAYMSKSILRVEGLNKSFHKKQAVRDVSFSMTQGEVVGLLGPNGAGKTTSFYMIVGFYTPNSGGIYLDDRCITNLPMYKRARIGISYLPQEASVFRKLSVEQNIDAILETRKDLSRAERKEKLDSLLEEFGITANRKQPAYTLSGGERRRTEIARALAIEPKFLLLDEPFAGIDPIAVHDIKLIIRLLARQNIGVLITDHNVRDTLEITDRAYIINKGEIVEQGPRQKILKSEIARKVYLGEEFRM